MYISQPIVDAYLTEQNQQWFGGACHTSCLNAPFFQNVVVGNGLVIPYEVPVKNEGRYLDNAIEWVSWADVNFDEYLKEEFFKPIIMR
ncbi:hypothetical protein ASG89_15580 [Paenibacillus sp. Soil766]|uniref:hypothetical protein n=1 Tax=Paenibacillus sp. Soil766 TaxID=1736404 RepID=UPI00070A8FA2|nr:hypothetical protein [Paenibacillus sp. Soil766]KRF09637.1 hypothetical protein ASG89_15580 [Paenibacillus sp. Soil766]